MTEPRANRQSAFENALAELRAGRIEWAASVCDRILDAAPQDPAAHQLAATIALRRGRLDEAARWANSSLQPAPRSFTDVDRRCACGARRGRSCAGANVVGTRSPFGPRSAGACLLELARRSSSSGDEKARSVLEDLLLRFPNFVDGWREIGKALSKAGQPKTAVLAFARAAKSSADPMDHARLGAALQTHRSAAGGDRRFSTSARGRARSCRSESSAWGMLATDGRSATGPRSSLNKP